MAVLLKEYANEEVDLAKVIPMVLLHDLVEIDAGDTYAYDQAGLATQRARETKDPDRIFGMLPEDQGTKFRNLWEEFGSIWRQQKRKFAHVLDNCQPLLLNDASGGKSWKNILYIRVRYTKEMEGILQEGFQGNMEIYAAADGQTYSAGTCDR